MTSTRAARATCAVLVFAFAAACSATDTREDPEQPALDASSPNYESDGTLNLAAEAQTKIVNPLCGVGKCAPNVSSACGSGTAIDPEEDAAASAAETGGTPRGADSQTDAGSASDGAGGRDAGSWQDASIRSDASASSGAGGSTVSSEGDARASDARSGDARASDASDAAHADASREASDGAASGALSDTALVTEASEDHSASQEVDSSASENTESSLPAVEGGGDELAQSDPEPADTASPVGTNAASACYLRTSNGSVVRTCEPAGSQPKDAVCDDSGDCSAGLGCVEETDSDGSTIDVCRTLVCVLPADCSDGSIYDTLPLREHGVTLSVQVPVCRPIHKCTLLEDSCAAGSTCALVGDNLAACVLPGSAQRNEPCSDSERCAANLVCSKTSGRCLQLCHVGSSECAGFCQGGSTSLPTGIGVCVGEDP